jgi:hypothetical protein
MITQSKHFDTLEAMIADASRDSQWATDVTSKGKTGSARQFTGSASFDETVSLARTGWQDGLKKMTKGVHAIASSQAVGRAPAYSLDVAGAYPIPALAAAGLPDCMVALAPVQERTRPIVRLIVTVSVMAGFTAEAFANYGAALVSIIDALEANDCRVELTVAACSSPLRSLKEKALYTVRIKEAQDSVDLDRMAFCLSHISFFRRLFFAIYENNAPQYFHDRSSRTPDRDEVEQGLIIIPSAMSLGDDDLLTPESAFKALLPIVSVLLTEHDATIPPLIFDRG